MSAVSKRYYDEPPLKELFNGDRMTRMEFHGIYETMPDDFKAELIGGIVYVASPLKLPHGKYHSRLGSIFEAYEAATAGVQACDNTTVMLSNIDEVQPDLFLRILPEYGGQSRNTKDEYVDGAPELVVEIAHSSRAIDLHAKRKRYAKSGVREYLVVCLRPKQIHWFNLVTGAMLTSDDNEIFRSLVFPGLWIDANALLELKYERTMNVLNQGLKGHEHEAFVERLSQAHIPEIQ